ncbi:MAG: NADPH:quinone oxidoreductase family protein [Gammaproteobacteria bacterium]|nr:NADPH:quinone oxidoreductase family protein [Gammaproteobacteria bacterium]
MTATPTMQAWQFERYGHYTDALHWTTRELPMPGPRQARVRTAAAALNFPDILIVAGKYQHKAPLPAVPGVEGVGVVEAVGPGSKFKLGDRAVGFCHGGGTLADAFLVDDASAWTVPAHITDEQAAALSVTYGTSWFGLTHRAGLAAGETLLVLGAAGGVGLAAIQLGKLLDATVIACAGDARKLAVCRDNGADHVIDYRREDLVTRVKEITDGRGADVIYDPVGGDLFEQVKRCVAWGGRLVVIGFAGGHIPQIELNRILLKNMAVVGLAWGQYLDRGSKLPEKAQFEFYDMIARRQIDPVIFRTLPFADVKEGLRLIESREVYGKVVITR